MCTFPFTDLRSHDQDQIGPNVMVRSITGSPPLVGFEDDVIVNVGLKVFPRKN